jgi:predicted phosphodiesterase
MKIQLASDLHLEFLQHDHPGERLIAPVTGADVLVLAGDIANGADALSLFANWNSSNSSSAIRVPVVMVAGNHEFYGHPIEPMRLKMKEAAAANNIHFLENESVVIGNVRFLGTTLWTDFRFDRGRTQSQQMHSVERGLNDHRAIRTGRHLFTAQDALSRHVLARAWLEQEFAKPWSGKTVVVTHHGPHPLSVHPRFIGSDLNPGFVSDLSDLMPEVDLWLHGHVHDGVDYQVGRCRVVANPAGYVLNRRYAKPDDFAFENSSFDRNLLLELVA